MTPYTKPFLTYDEQIALLERRGLIFTDKQKAKQILSNINYYRLSAYMLPFKKRNNSVVLDKFKDNVSFGQIYRLYLFDRKLRLLVFDAIERIEIAIRTQIIYQLSKKYGSHWQDNKDIFKPPTTKISKSGTIISYNIYQEIQDEIQKQLNNNKAEIFIKHYKETYSSPSNPPSWMSIEILYFSHLSKICNNLKDKKDITNIAKYFSLPQKTFCSWIHTINYIRNLVAHHARLWNRNINIMPDKFVINNSNNFHSNLNWINYSEEIRTDKLYYSLCILQYFLQTVNPTSPFKTRLFDLIDNYNDCIYMESMGFPENWQSENLWKENNF
jgi:abortive infection bacteriophage resistance protein